MAGGPAMAPAAAWWPGAGAGAWAQEQEEMRWRQLDGGVSAVSFGFVATAMLVSMFLAMAVLEHFLRAPPMGPPEPSPPRGPRGLLLRFLRRGRRGGRGPPGADLEAARKLDAGCASPEMPVYSKGVSVLMPGQDVPTFIAHPAPAPCPPERVRWPSHQPAPFAGSSSNPC
ncbi:uncharacterized protein [Aegilops tauschii subsp. strangulata]|uniref:Uncharacterized protein n=1 Tax=Aegilops tauschii subsp. strangulata TaxID=200361 RepID=A0A453E422_AEGTS|nr:uncharacterized protein LOC109769934 [Aegilops tauschii subsp. strangulata]